jgi:carbamoyltransferase
LRKSLRKASDKKTDKIPIYFSDHHLSHAASAFYPSPFQEAAILTLDGVGEWSTASIALGKDHSITTLREMHFPHSLGLLYSAFTYYLGFEVNSGEYKMMGLAPYAERNAPLVKEYKSIIEKELVKVFPDGSIEMNQRYFSYAHNLKMVPDDQWKRLFGFKKRLPSEEINENHTSMAQAIQLLTEEIILKMATTAKAITGAENLCLAGGVALNCVANGRLKASGLFKDIFIQPAAGDAGGAIGAALAYYFSATSERNSIHHKFDAYLGPSYTDKDILKALRKAGLKYRMLEKEELSSVTAQYLSEGKVVGWFQGRMEFGPRALGHRSILGDPRNPEMQKSLNLKVKFRESFRPFAPIVKEDKASLYFEMIGISPYMLEVYPIKDSLKLPLPANYANLSMMEKLYVQKSKLPAITHCDFSARIQTVNAESEALLYQLLDDFEKISDYPILVNTSFNIKDEPIVCSPDDAVQCFLKTGIDILVLGNFMVESKEK